MKKVQLFSLFGVLALLTACGNQPQNPAAFNYGQGYNPYGQQTGWNNGWNTGSWNSGWYSQPMALAGSVYTRTFQVQVGQPIPSIRWGAYIKCDRKAIDSYEVFDGGVLPGAAMNVAINGQPITNGTPTAPMAGNLTLTVDLNAYSTQIHCAKTLFGSSNRPYQIIQFWVQQL